MRKVHEPEWDDSSDPFVVDWYRVRAGLEHENSLKNQRLTWLLSSQGFFFAAYVLTFTASTRKDFEMVNLPVIEVLMAVIALTAIAVALFIFLGVKAAEAHHKTLEIWWTERVKLDELNRHPTICGSKPKVGITVHQYLLPLLFIPTWMLLTAVAFKELFLQNLTTIASYMGVAVLVVGALALGFLAGRGRRA